MKKALYIQIDNNSLPEGCGEEIEVLDCRCINDFCSIVGDALVSDLKDEGDKLFYRLINPVGRLLMDFKTANEEVFNEIISKWYDYLGEFLHKGILESEMTIKFPQTYIDWLLQNDNPYYESVGKELQKRNGKISIPSEDITEEIISALYLRINHILNSQADIIEGFVISDSRIKNSSFVVREILHKNSSVFYVCFHDFIYSLKLKSLDDYRLFKLENPLGIGDIILGETRKDDLEDWEWDVFCMSYGLICEFKNDLWNEFSIQSDNLDDIEVFNEIASIVWGKKVNYKDICFNEWQQNLQGKGFVISICPKWVDWEGHTSFMAQLMKETNSFVCKLMFLDTAISKMEIDNAKKKTGTLWGVKVALK